MLHNVCLAHVRLAFVFFFLSTTIRICIRPNTAVNYSVFGRILKTHIWYSPSFSIVYSCQCFNTVSWVTERHPASKNLQLYTEFLFWVIQANLEGLRTVVCEQLFAGQLFTDSYLPDS